MDGVLELPLDVLSDDPVEIELIVEAETVDSEFVDSETVESESVDNDWLVGELDELVETELIDDALTVDSEFVDSDSVESDCVDADSEDVEVDDPLVWDVAVDDVDEVLLKLLGVLLELEELALLNELVGDE